MLDFFLNMNMNPMYPRNEGEIHGLNDLYYKLTRGIVESILLGKKKWKMDNSQLVIFGLYP